MAIIDQSEIDALLAAAGDGGGGATTATAPRPTVARRPKPSAYPPDTARLLKIRVPIIVELARRTMSIATARGLSPGSIIEFTKPVAEELDLLVNNRLIGRGVCVKVGENFGLRVNRVVDKSERIRSLRDPE